MNTAKLTILYSRLSREDERENESVSIENQKAFLEEYATRNDFNNFIHLVDDGWSGTRWDRPAFMQMLDMVESGNVEQICIKDMSRLGRDHLRVGLFLEQLRDKGVRLIAVAENIDTAKGEDDFMPFRNLFAEWHARDTSRKIRAINDARTKNGKRVTGAVPYGYIHDPNDRQKWVLDEGAAPIVQRIFRSIIEGKSVTKIAEELTAEILPTPSTHWTNINAGMPGKPNAYPTRWSVANVINICKQEEYMGWKVLNKTKKESYKTKKRSPNPDKLIFKDDHPAIVDEETWILVQKLRKTIRKPEKTSGAPNPLTGILFCADCGVKMYHKRGKTGRVNKPHNEYICTSYRHYSRSCTYHYIRVEVLENLILTAIRRVSKYVRNNETEFVERVRQESVLQQESAVKESRKKLSKHNRRRDEIATLIKKLYESYALDKIPEKHFTELLAGYDAEQANLDTEIAKLQSEIENYNTDSVRADKFIELVHRHTEFTEFSATLLNQFIEKIIVHEAIKVDGVRTMQLDIYMNFIGKFDLPQSEYENEPQEPPKTTGSKGRKLRHTMTEEELKREREIDRRYYAKKKAKRIAEEEKRRVEILSGTSYEAVLADSASELPDAV
jgi:DNA invertase Pin-like site-specific DNA recombinase